MRVLILLLALSACKEKPRRYVGLPDGAVPSCSQSLMRNDRLRCIAEGTSYLCIRDEYHDEFLYSCMPYRDWRFWR